MLKVHRASMQMWYATVKTGTGDEQHLASIPEHPRPPPVTQNHLPFPSLPFIGNCYLDFRSHFLLFSTLVPPEYELINTIAQVSRFVNFAHVKPPLHQSVSGFFWWVMLIQVQERGWTPIHAVAWSCNLFIFYGSVVLHCMSILHLMFESIPLWMYLGFIFFFGGVIVNIADMNTIILVSTASIHTHS